MYKEGIMIVIEWVDSISRDGTIITHHIVGVGETS